MGELTHFDKEGTAVSDSKGGKELYGRVDTF